MGIRLQDDDGGGHTVVILQGCDEKEKEKNSIESSDSKQIHRGNKNSFTLCAVKDNNRGYVTYNGLSTLFYINTKALCKCIVKRTKECTDCSFNVQLHTPWKAPHPHHFHHYYTRQPPMKYWHFQGMRSLC